MKSIIITGDDSIIDVIAKENRMRVLRGKVTIKEITDGVEEKKADTSKIEKLKVNKPAAKPTGKPASKPSGKPVAKANAAPVSKLESKEPDKA